MVLAKLRNVRSLHNEQLDFENTMAEFEDELIDAEASFNNIKLNMYHFDSIIVNISGKL